MISVENVSMRFTVPGQSDVHALNNINLTIKKGELLSVLGPSGCGKSTLLNIIAGFLAPTEGATLFNGSTITSPDKERGMVFQQGALFEWLSVFKNIEFGMKMSGGYSAGQRAKIVQDLLDTVGLKAFANKPVYQLSGGMQQRVALARCLANDPEVILMDEPLGALDALTREKMQDLVLKVWKRTGKTIILITHSVEEALFLGERLIVMAPRPGRIFKEYQLPFAEQGVEMSARQIKAQTEFVKTREDILSLIWSMEESIMNGEQVEGE